MGEGSAHLRAQTLEEPGHVEGRALPRRERRWGHGVVFGASKWPGWSPGFTRGHTRQVRGQSEVWETPWSSWESWTKETRSWTDQRSRCGASNGWQAELM